jgi:hypothetical protein
MTTGMAIRETRRNLTERHGPDICWLSYILYGDPRFRYFRRERNSDLPVPESQIKQEKQKKMSPVSRQTALTRGTILNYSLNTLKLKEIQTWLFLLAAIMAVAAVAGIWHFTGKWIVFTQEKEKDTRVAEIRRMMIDRAEKQQERTERLFEELSKITEPLPSPAKTKDEALTLATVFDSQTVKQGKERIILHAVQDQILHGQSPYRLLEQESFDVILEELIRNIRLARPEDRVRPGLLTPKLILFLEVYDEGSKTLVLMRLIDNKTRRILDTLFEELDNSKHILAQKEILCTNLLQKLQKYEKIY